MIWYVQTFGLYFQEERRGSDDRRQTEALVDDFLKSHRKAGSTKGEASAHQEAGDLRERIPREREPIARGTFVHVSNLARVNAVLGRVLRSLLCDEFIWEIWLIS